MSLENGFVRQTGQTVGNVMSVMCRRGLALIGNLISECREDGTWSGKLPQCTG